MKLAALFFLWLIASPALAQQPAQPAEFAHARIVETWKAYSGLLGFGKGQTLALIDDGCKLAMPEWQAAVDGVPKVRVTWDAVDGDPDPKHEGSGYHGSTIGIPSSVNHGGKWGVAHNNQVAVIRGLENVHGKLADAPGLARALKWVVENHAQHGITTVNLAPVDDKEHAGPVATEIDVHLAELRRLNIWVSAPAGNHTYSKGISWPAVAKDCFAVGAVKPVADGSSDTVYLDRSAQIDLLVPARATSSSNAILCGSAMILREAIEKGGYDWKQDGPTLPEAMMAIFQKTGRETKDPASGLTFRRLDLMAALGRVFPVR